MRVPVITMMFITLSVATLSSSPIMASNESQFINVVCPNGYTRERQGSSAFRCSRQNGNSWQYRTASCRNVLSNIPGINWTLAFDHNNNRWGCRGTGFGGEKWHRIDNQTCAAHSGYSANPGAPAHQRGQTCRRAVPNIQYRHPSFHRHS